MVTAHKYKPGGVSEIISMAKCAFFLATSTLSSNSFDTGGIMLWWRKASLPIAWPTNEKISFTIINAKRFQYCLFYYEFIHSVLHELLYICCAETRWT